MTFRGTSKMSNEYVPRKQLAKRSARKITRMTGRYATKTEGVGVVTKVSKPGSSKAFRQAYVSQVRKELGGKAAKQARKSVRTLERVTAGTSQKSASRRQAARRAARKSARS